MSRIALGLGLQDRVRLGKGGQITQAILEDVVEAIAGAINKELGIQELQAWTTAAFEPMANSYKEALIGEFLDTDTLAREPSSHVVVRQGKPSRLSMTLLNGLRLRIRASGTIETPGDQYLWITSQLNPAQQSWRGVFAPPPGRMNSLDRPWAPWNPWA
jgi:hypothetical protein